MKGNQFESRSKTEKEREIAILFRYRLLQSSIVEGISRFCLVIND